MLEPKIHFEKVPLEVVLRIANQAVLPKKEERTKAAAGKSPVRKSGLAAAASVKEGEVL
jgi:hypothetical protein